MEGLLPDNPGHNYTRSTGELVYAIDRWAPGHSNTAMAMSTPDSTPLTPDDVFEILSNHRRRMVLYYLREHGDSAGVKELAEAIAAMENEIPAEELTSQQRKRVYVSLYQTHLPKMADAQVIEYDKDEGTVRLTDRTSSIDQYLGNDESPSYPWRVHYLVLGMLGGGLWGLSFTELAVFGAISALWMGIGVVLLFAVSAVVQYWLDYRDDAEIPLELTLYDR